ncbi:hypothetical protein Hanom_Chr04g00316561 [Helianthus anomalus]
MLVHKVKKTELLFKLTKRQKYPWLNREKRLELASRMKMARFQTLWIQMRKNKPLDKSSKTGQTLGTKMAFYSKQNDQKVSTYFIMTKIGLLILPSIDPSGAHMHLLTDTAASFTKVV